MKKAVVLSPRDNVATAITDIAGNTRVELEDGNFVDVSSPISFGHKFALSNIAAGAPVLKYGEIIGEATEAIGAGEHVHVHNVGSRRGRGDLKTEGR